MIYTRRFKLTGTRRDFTGVLVGSRPFKVEDGVITVQSQKESDILGWTNYIEMMWAGFPEGDPRIKATEDAIAAAHAAEGTKAPEAESKKESTDGQRDVQEGADKPDGQADVQGGVQPEGSRAPAGEPESNDGSGAGEPEDRAEDAAGPHGDGQPASVNPKLLKAVQSLDPKNDAHWTKDGKPALAAVEGFYGSSGVTRALIDATAPGLRRPS